jgi:hypothetical protein
MWKNDILYCIDGIYDYELFSVNDITGTELEEGRFTVDLFYM